MPSRIIRSDFVFPIQVEGWKIYYGDATLARDAEGNVLGLASLPTILTSSGLPRSQWPARWASGAADNVQVVNVYYDRTFIDRFDEYAPGGIKTVREVVKRYKDVLHGAVNAYDWFWADLSSRTFGMASDLPSMPVGTVNKQGRLIDNDLWSAIYSYAYEDWTL